MGIQIKNSNLADDLALFPFIDESIINNMVQCLMFVCLCLGLGSFIDEPWTQLFCYYFVYQHFRLMRNFKISQPNFELYQCLCSLFYSPLLFYKNLVHVSLLYSKRKLLMKKKVPSWRTMLEHKIISIICNIKADA